MPLDHYIPQVHLRNFYSPALGNRMYAIRKRDLKGFTPRSEDICRIMDGGTNAYLLGERAIEDFLKTIEPQYNVSLEKLKAGKIDKPSIYAIAGFVAYVISCSPAAMRIGSEPLKSTLKTTAAILEEQGLLPSPPPELGETTLTKLLQEGAVKFTIDPKYPQAIGINSIIELTARFGNFKWDILHNDFNDSPFFTSDFPAAIEKTKDLRIINRIVPLAPNLAIRIKPDLKLDKDQFNLEFANFGYRRCKVNHEDIVSLNRLIVRCAEESVFYRDDRSWIRPFIAKNRHYYIEPYTYRQSTPTGMLQIVANRVVTRTP